MKKVWFAALAALGFALAIGAVAPVVNAETSLHPPNQNEGSNN